MGAPKKKILPPKRHSIDKVPQKGHRQRTDVNEGCPMMTLNVDIEPLWMATPVPLANRERSCETGESPVPRGLAMAAKRRHV